MAKGPAVAVHVAFPLLLALAVSFLFQVSDCSRSSPQEPATPAVLPHPLPRDETGTRPPGAEVEGGAEGAAAARDEQVFVGHPDGGVGSSGQGGALMAMPLPVLARRFLSSGAPPAQAGAADSAARSSCHSSDVHIGCDPPSHN
ncbi:hypothetical protein BAE44_0025690 [Dichanthelium oligosanthes]|uniref:Uncharacterized protein n=1 Tax=Dichanthelium oligosanthes TaxID=888268 RepID=A0A1E5UKE8_9POAL|nr:hypothetical protein BAE44_0025690 [Dichanthelium oligosanthes]